jgi:hypothetical protein
MDQERWLTVDFGKACGGSVSQLGHHLFDG